MAEVESLEEIFLEHPYTPNRKDNYLPNKLVVTNTQFTRVEQRLFEFFVNQIDHTKINEKHGLKVRIPISEIKEFITTRQVLSVTNSMARKVLTIFNLSGSHLEFQHIPLFSNIRYNKDNNGFLEFWSNSELSPYLANLGSQYTRYDFKTILNFKSIYSTLMYKLLRLHLGQNRKKFIYSIDELRQLLQVDPQKYKNLNDFKKNVLEPVKEELRNSKGFPITFEYEHYGNKQRNVTHLQFSIYTALELSRFEKEEFMEAVTLNPQMVYNRLEEITIKEYNLKDNLRRQILDDKDLRDKFVTLHIEFENGVYPKVKNKTAYILTCLGLVTSKKKQI
jgi:plasmid replication initiation protein